MVDFDFNTYNLNKILTKMNSELISGVEEEIYKTFDKLSSDYSWYPESTKTNIHYFNGWKTNKAHKVGMKAIIPANGVFSSYSWDKNSFSYDEYDPEPFFDSIALKNTKSKNER